MYKLKKTTSLPDAQFIFDNSWGANKQNVRHALQYAQDKESQCTVKDGVSYDEFYRIVEDYFLWLSDMLSQKEVLYLSEVKEELDSLGLDEVVD